MKFYIGSCECEWFYAIFPRECMALKGLFHSPIGKHRGWLIRRKCWHGEVWYHLPSYLGVELITSPAPSLY